MMMMVVLVDTHTYTAVSALGADVYEPLLFDF